MLSQVINTIWIPEFFADKNGRVEVKSLSASAPAATTNHPLITGVAGKRIIILHAVINSNGAQTAINLKSNSGGASKMYLRIPANTVERPNVEIGPAKFGVIALDTSHSLVCDTDAVAMNCSFTYVMYTP